MPVLCCTLSCGSEPRPITTPIATTPPVDSTQPSQEPMPVASATSNDAPTAQGPIVLHYEFVAAEAGRPSRVDLVSPELGLREQVASAPEPFLCVLRSQPTGDLTTGDVPRLLVCDPGGDGVIPFRRESDALVVVGDHARVLKQVSIDPSRRLPPPSVIEGPPRQQPCGDVRGPKVDVFLDRVTMPADAQGYAPRTLRLRIPALNVEVPLARAADAPDQYGRTIINKPRRMRVEISGHEGSTASYDLIVRDDTLLVKLFLSTKSDLGDRRTEWARLRLPCGADVRWHELNVTDRAWNAPWGAKGLRCITGYDACARRCYDQHADDDGELSAAGESCTATCQSNRGQCFERLEAAMSATGK